MDLKFELVPSTYFLKQVEKLPEKKKDKISTKLNLVKNKPFRFKSLSGYKHFKKSSWNVVGRIWKLSTKNLSLKVVRQLERMREHTAGVDA